MRVHSLSRLLAPTRSARNELTRVGPELRSINAPSASMELSWGRAGNGYTGFPLAFYTWKNSCTIRAIQALFGLIRIMRAIDRGLVECLNLVLYDDIIVVENFK